MINVYSDNVIVPAEGIYPLNVVTLRKGCTASINGTSIELNKAGVYMVSVDATLDPTADGTVGIQLVRDGVEQADAVSIVEGVTATPASLSFETLVQCPQNNTGCCCSMPTTLIIKNTGEQEANGHIHVVVTKVC
jgi:hypothetical protein